MNKTVTLADLDTLLASFPADANIQRQGRMAKSGHKNALKFAYNLVNGGKLEKGATVELVGEPQKAVRVRKPKLVEQTEHKVTVPEVPAEAMAPVLDVVPAMSTVAPDADRGKGLPIGFSKEAASHAGRLGGYATSANREHMAEIGRKGAAARKAKLEAAKAAAGAT